MSARVIVPPAALPVALAELKSYLGNESACDDAAAAAALRSATELCEQFVGFPLLRRELELRVAARHCWEALPVNALVAITAVARALPDGSSTALAIGDYAVDIDADARGWIRAGLAEPATLVVRCTAGAALDWNDVPEPLRQGVLRLAGHLLSAGATDAAPPAAVSALWRPFRRMRLASGAAR